MALLHGLSFIDLTHALERILHRDTFLFDTLRNVNTYINGLRIIRDADQHFIRFIQSVNRRAQALTCPRDALTVLIGGIRYATGLPPYDEFEQRAAAVAINDARTHITSADFEDIAHILDEDTPPININYFEPIGPIGPIEPTIEPIASHHSDDLRYLFKSIEESAHRANASSSLVVFANTLPSRAETQSRTGTWISEAHLL